MTDSARLRELAAAATPGPWVDQEPGPNDVGAGTRWVDTHAYAEGPEPVFGPDYQVSVADAALIVEAVNALPALLDELDALRKVAEAARALLSYPGPVRMTREAHPGCEPDECYVAALRAALDALEARRDPE